MSTHRRTAVCAAGGLAIAALSYAAPPQPIMAVDVGLWEVTTHPQTSGGPLIPEAQLAQLSPEQRAKLEAMLAARGNQVQKFKECMTEEKRSRGFGSHSDRGTGCKTTVATNTSSEYEMRHECSTDEGQMTTTAHFKIASRHAASGTVDIVRTTGGNSTTIHTTIDAKWLGSDCGDVKDVQREK